MRTLTFTPPDWPTMANDFTFHLTTTRFDENYTPSEHSRITTNFANLARGEERQQNLRSALAMITDRFNGLARTGNPERDRYRVELDIISVTMQWDAEGADREFPMFEVLEVHILDQHTGIRHQGIVGNNFSSYIRDYDFSVRLPAHAASGGDTPAPEDFGDLHGAVFAHFLDSSVYRDRFAQSPVICISVSTSRTYTRTEFVHPVLGVEYRQDAYSATDAYFAKMGLRVRYFMPQGSVAPLAFYFREELTEAYGDLALIGTISTMETFQKIYRPEIYNARIPAGTVYRPTLEAQEFTRTGIDYDRVERNQLARTQGLYTEEHLMIPHGEDLARWVTETVAVAR